MYGNFSLRPSFVLIHRYVGLVIAGFLLIAGLTGALLAWYDDLDMAINAAWHQVTISSPGVFAPDPLLVRKTLLEKHPGVQISYLLLAPAKPDKTFQVYVSPRPDSATGRVTPLLNNQWFVNPHTFDVMGKRQWGDITQGVKNLMPFIYRLHYTLALGEIGRSVFGVIALLWTLDCFVGAYLTFPVRSRRKALTPKRFRHHTKSWWQRWRPTWRVRWKGGSYRLNVDLHRAGGLWVGAMLLVLAWSGVAFNLSEVYNPVMRSVFAHQEDIRSLPALSSSQLDPPIDWFEARTIGRGLMEEQAQAQAFTVNHESSMYYDAERAVYFYSVHSSRDVGNTGNTSVVLDASSGELKGIWLPTGAASGDTITTWMENLHKAALWGWPFKLFISLMGMAVAMLSMTGVIIWWRKRKARVRAQLNVKKRLDKVSQQPFRIENKRAGVLQSNHTFTD